MEWASSKRKRKKTDIRNSARRAGEKDFPLPLLQTAAPIIGATFLPCSWVMASVKFSTQPPDPGVPFSAERCREPLEAQRFCLSRA